MNEDEIEVKGEGGMLLKMIMILAKKIKLSPKEFAELMSIKDIDYTKEFTIESLRLKFENDIDEISKVGKK